MGLSPLISNTVSQKQKYAKYMICQNDGKSMTGRKTATHFVNAVGKNNQMEKEKTFSMRKPLLKNYSEAFEKFSGLKKGEYEIKADGSDGPATVKCKNDVYKVANEKDMYDHFKAMLTVKEEACFVKIYYWIDVAEQVHQVPKFIEELIPELNGKDEFEALNFALTLSANASNSAKVFWETIYSLSELEVYPKAILAACKTYDLEIMLQDYMDLILNDGENQFTELVSGVFETIEINGDEEKTGDYYYIYTVDPNYWTL